MFLTKIGNNAGNIIITMPYESLKIKLNEENSTNFDLSLFEKNKVDVDIIVGNTKLKIADINQLDAEDILVLENSNLENMTLKLSKGEKVKFRLNPDPTLIVNNDEDNDSEYEQNTPDREDNIMVNDNIWDNILVDVEAQFEKVKLELGKIRRINKGEVVEIADVFKNKINLCVENKIIANGELVIINDKYGIKINEIFSNSNNNDQNGTNEEQIDEQNNDTSTQNNEENNSNNENNNANANANDEDENFDYSDFDVDDEDI